MSNRQQIWDGIGNTAHFTVEEATARGFQPPPDARPRFEDLREDIRSTITSLANSPEMDSFDKLAMIHQTTAGLVERIEEDAATDIDRDFSTILARGKGDCDDFVVVERALIEYANEQGVFDPPMTIGVVGAKMTYSAEVNGSIQTKQVDHDFLLTEQNGELIMLDGSSQSPASFDGQGNIRLYIEAGERLVPATVNIDQVDYFQNAEGINLRPESYGMATSAAPAPEQAVQPAGPSGP